jgi:hypothetical protein
MDETSGGDGSKAWATTPALALSRAARARVSRFTTPRVARIGEAQRRTRGRSQDRSSATPRRAVSAR